MYSKFVEILQKMGITPYKVSKETGISQVTLTNWKNGIYTPKIDKLQKIADYLGVDVRYFTSCQNDIGKTIPIIRNHIKKLPVNDKENIIYDIPQIFPDQCSFGIISKDDSLNSERVGCGDIVCFSSSQTAVNGELGAILIADEILIRRIYYCDNRTIVIGIADTAPLILSGDDLKKTTILGKAVGFISKF